MRIAIAGAAGNLGSLLAWHLAQTSHHLILLTHSHSISANLTKNENVEIKRLDLGNLNSLHACLDDTDCVVHLAGVLFRGAPEKFLPVTNIQYVENLASEATRAGVKKFILFSFPHVEGETSPDSPAKGVIPERDPTPIHARTRLAAERSLIRICHETTMRYLILRAGVIYGEGVKLTTQARKYMRYGTLAIWRKATWVHLLALPDLLEITQRCIEAEDIDGILNVADDQPLLLQDFLNQLAAHWKCKQIHIAPEVLFRFAARSLDLISRIFNCTIPLNPDILQMGMMSTVCDTTRLKKELDSRLKYPTLKKGITLI